MNKIARLQALLKDIGNLQEEADRLAAEIAAEGSKKAATHATQKPRATVAHAVKPKQAPKPPKVSQAKPKKSKKKRQGSVRHLQQKEERRVAKIRASYKPIKPQTKRYRNRKQQEAVYEQKQEARIEWFVQRIKDKFGENCMSTKVEEAFRMSLHLLGRSQMNKILKRLGLWQAYYDSGATYGNDLDGAELNDILHSVIVNGLGIDWRDIDKEA